MDNTVFDQVVNKAQQAGEFIADKASVAVDFVTLECKAASLRGKIDAQYKALGKAYYELSETEAEDTGALLDVMDAIKALKADLSAVEADMSKYKNVCPACHAVNAAKAEFCSKCGAKLKQEK